MPGRAEEQRGEEGCHRSFAVLCGLVLIYRGPICRWGLRWTAVGEQGYCWTPWCGLSISHGLSWIVAQHLVFHSREMQRGK